MHLDNQRIRRGSQRGSVIAGWFRPALLGTVLLAWALTNAARSDDSFWSGFWSGSDLYRIADLAIDKLGAQNPASSNRVAKDPRAAALGKKLFTDPRFSANGAVSCSGCHMPDRLFQDDRKVGHGIADVARRTPSLVGASYSAFLFWDGRKDSLWSQALGPLESAAEHGADRAMIAQLIAANYRDEFETVFGKLPDLGDLPAHASPLGNPEAVAAWTKLNPAQQQAINQTFANMGKAIEAFERTIPVPRTRFDDFAAALAAKDMAAADKIFTPAERNGLKLFIGKGDCVRCHAGPLFTDTKFYNLGLPGTSAATDNGRDSAVNALKDDPFNCLGAFSDASRKAECIQTLVISFNRPEQVGAFKSPTLRGAAQHPPYMHNGQFATLREVMKHYNEAPKAPFGTTELKFPRKLTDDQLAELEAFIGTLNIKPEDVQ